MMMLFFYSYILIVFTTIYYQIDIIHFNVIIITLEVYLHMCMIHFYIIVLDICL